MQLERVRAVVRKQVPHLTDDRYLHPDLMLAAQWVRDGVLIDTVGAQLLPQIRNA